MAEILSNPIWVTVFICVITVLVVVIVELNYRLFAKRMLDIIFASVCIIATSPALIALAIISKVKEGRVYDLTPYLSFKGKIVSLHSFAGVEGGVKHLARILDIFLGSISFVGVRLMPIEDGALISDEDMARFNVRSGLINCLVLKGNENLTYEESFQLDIAYAKRSELFCDIWIIIKTLVYVLRGERGIYVGELADNTYGEVLLQRGTITAEQLEQAKTLAQETLENPHDKRIG